MVSPSGSTTATSGGVSPFSSRSVAAMAAAVAQVPVVSPLFRGKNSGSSRSTVRRRPCGPSTMVHALWDEAV